MPTETEDMHRINADFIAFLQKDRMPGQVPFLPLETPEVERRFVQILDSECFMPWVVEDGTPTGRWTAIDIEDREIGRGDWEAFLMRARKECGFRYPAYMHPTAPDGPDA